MSRTTRVPKQRLLITGICLFAMASCAGAATIHVNAEGTGDYATIQAAIDAALVGDVIELADGVFRGEGNKNLDYAGKAITVRSVSGDPENCIIDCESDGRGFYFHSNEGADSVLEGVMIRNGYVHSYDFEQFVKGGGVLCVDSSPVLLNCTITQNTASAEYATGGGVCIEGDLSSPDFRDCVFRENRVSAESASGAGVFCSGGSPTFMNCSFIANHGMGLLVGGGGLAVLDCNAELLNCVFRGNVLSGFGVDGAGIQNIDSTSVIINCTFTRNVADGISGYWENGGAIANYRCNPVITNCVLWGNTPDEVSNLQDSLPVVTYSLVQGGQGEEWFGAGCIDVDPLFAFDADQHLMPDSPCVDAGTNSTSPSLPSIDADGTPRILDGNGDSNEIVDMGAYEFDQTTSFIAVDSDQITFRMFHGQADSDPQNLLIRNSASGTLNWEITGMPSWLSVSPASGVSNGEAVPVTMSVDASGLERGQYAKTLDIVDSSSSNTPRTVKVSLEIAGTISVPAEYPSIQAAIDSAFYGDVIELVDGTYSGEENRDLDFKGRAITVKSASGNPSLCLIDCQHQGRGFHFVNSEQASSVLEGITICNGEPGSAVHPLGGGIRCFFSSPTIRNCVIRDNTTTGQGGGIAAHYNANVAIDDCVFTGNSAGYGGGAMWISNTSSPSINGCIFSDNTTDGNGAGLYVYDDSHPTINDCEFLGNTAQGHGGGIKIDIQSSPIFSSCEFKGNVAEYSAGIDVRNYSNPEWTNCLFAGNRANHDAGAMAILDWCEPVFENCTFTENKAMWKFAQTGGLYTSLSVPVIWNCIFWNNTNHEFFYRSSPPEATYSLVQDGSGSSWFGAGCIDTDPLFVDADGPDDDPATWQDNDYRISPGSPCIDAGDNDAADGSLTDLDGNPRFVDDPATADTGNGEAPVIDMGAYEYPGEAFPGDLDGNGTVDLDDYGLFASCLAGPGVTVPPAGVDPELFEMADLDGDGDVDLKDYAVFQRSFHRSE